MHLDPTNHEAARAMIDKSLAGAASPEEEQLLREHLAACDSCNEYLEAGRRAIAGLGGLCFDLDPALDRRVFAALDLRAQQLEASRAPHARLAWAWALALLLTVAGSILAAQLGSHAAATFHLDGVQVRLGLATFWITPSLCICLRAAPASAVATRRAQQERNLAMNSQELFGIIPKPVRWTTVALFSIAVTVGMRSREHLQFECRPMVMSDPMGSVIWSWHGALFWSAPSLRCWVLALGIRLRRRPPPQHACRSVDPDCVPRSQSCCGFLLYFCAAQAAGNAVSAVRASDHSRPALLLVVRLSSGLRPRPEGSRRLRCRVRYLCDACRMLAEGNCDPRIPKSLAGTATICHRRLEPTGGSR